MANDAQRAQREAEMSAVHKRSRKVREKSKKINAVLRLRQQRNMDTL